ncbi:hypothetical protein AD949_04930 [Acetobacter orleanensis]|nr:hypothetical protein AD949_04930 [Acetobacter orleanensis]PCD79643.1 hypothetical protein CO710_05380 [Acetobacter orleanensis]
MSPFSEADGTDGFGESDEMEGSKNLILHFLNIAISMGYNFHTGGKGGFLEPSRLFHAALMMWPMSLKTVLASQLETSNFKSLLMGCGFSGRSDSAGAGVWQK